MPIKRCRSDDRVREKVIARQYIFLCMIFDPAFAQQNCFPSITSCINSVNLTVSKSVANFQMDLLFSKFLESYSFYKERYFPNEMCTNCFSKELAWERKCATQLLKLYYLYHYNYTLFHEQLRCLDFSLRFWRKLRQLLSTCPTLCPFSTFIKTLIIASFLHWYGSSLRKWYWRWHIIDWLLRFIIGFSWVIIVFSSINYSEFNDGNAMVHQVLFSLR